MPVDASLVVAGIATSRHDQLSPWDALVVEAARTGRCSHLVTEDLDHGQSHDGIIVHDPFQDDLLPQ